MEDTSTSNFTQNAAGVVRHSVGQRRTCFAGERALGIEIIRTVEDSANHVPLREPHGVIANGIEHTTVDLSLGFGVSRAGGAVPERRRARRTGSP